MINQDATVILDREPVTWLLYNRLVELGEWKHLRPNGRINFLPALTEAEEMLSSLVHDDLALSLFFFAVDKPSDKCPTERFDRKAASIASKFNGRISASFIGMTNSEEMDDTVLRSMAKTAQECGAEARFSMPPKDTRAFSGSTSSLASSLTMTKMNLSDKSQPQNQGLLNRTKRYAGYRWKLDVLHADRGQSPNQSTKFSKLQLAADSKCN